MIYYERWALEIFDQVSTFWVEGNRDQNSYRFLNEFLHWIWIELSGMVCDNNESNHINFEDH